jgi:hypothetical protein
VPASVLALQRTAGNAAVAAMIQRCGPTPCDCPGEGKLAEGEPAVQREAEKEAPKPAAKIDVAIVLSDDEQDLDEAHTLAKTAIRVTDVKDAAAKLGALGEPIGTVYVVSHSTSTGKVEFTSSIGTIWWVPIADLAKELKEAVTIDTVDFRGCSVGNAPKEMESFRKTVGARSVKSTNCFSFTSRVTPFTVNGEAVTRPDQIPKGRQGAFDKALREQIAALVTPDNKSVVKCLAGLSSGAKADPALAEIWKIYWANNGVLVAAWVSPNFDERWQQGSLCFKDMTAGTKPCHLVEAKAPAAGPAKTGVKKTP